MSAYLVTPCEHYTLADIMNGYRCQALCRGPVFTTVPDSPSIIVDGKVVKLEKVVSQVADHG